MAVRPLVLESLPMAGIASRLAPVLILAAASVACVAEEATPAGRSAVRLVTVAEGLEHPWGMAFLPDGRMLVTERPGRLRIVAQDGTVGPALEGVPAVDANDQGGLLGIALDPDFAINGRVYLSYAEPRDGGNGTSVARGRLGPRGLEDVVVIFRQLPTVRGGHHFGSRLVFARDGSLFVTLGERSSGRARAQTLDSHLGKVVRIDSDGGAPDDNPFVGRAGALPEIWSYGHRNVQGAALHPATGELWTVEHGPRGGDELNRTLAGHNFGWPRVSYGVEYSGLRISDSPHAPGVTPPAHHWVPSIATSGLMFYTGDRFADWRGSVFVGGLKSQTLVRLELDGERVVQEEVLLDGAVRERIRDVVQGPDGCIYLLTDEYRGRLLRMEPAD
jgi:aldose sugar dehydrogenase